MIGKKKQEWIFVYAMLRTESDDTVKTTWGPFRSLRLAQETVANLAIRDNVLQANIGLEDSRDKADRAAEWRKWAGIAQKT